MKTVRYIVAILVLVAVACSCSAARPLRRPEVAIRASLLKHTPLGTPRSDVRRFIKKEGWTLSRDTTVPPGAASPRDEAILGNYGIWFGTCTAYGRWTFDESDRLKELMVYKDRDVL